MCDLGYDELIGRREPKTVSVQCTMAERLVDTGTSSCSKAAELTTRPILSIDDLFSLLAQEKGNPAPKPDGDIVSGLLVRLSQLAAQLVDSKGGYSVVRAIAWLSHMHRVQNNVY